MVYRLEHYVEPDGRLAPDIYHVVVSVPWPRSSRAATGGRARLAPSHAQYPCPALARGRLGGQARGAPAEPTAGPSEPRSRLPSPTGARLVSRPLDLDDLTPRQVRAFRRSILRFYDERGRDLPWRETQDPYAILVSEVMLQQTRVETVVPYYEKWIARFPSIGALAEAETDEVLKLWEGLGYYARARNLRYEQT